jgi:thiol-disulfide isomerase/thioredoxin
MSVIKIGWIIGVLLCVSPFHTKAAEDTDWLTLQKQEAEQKKRLVEGGHNISKKYLDAMGSLHNSALKYAKEHPNGEHYVDALMIAQKNMMFLAGGPLKVRKASISDVDELSKRILAAANATEQEKQDARRSLLLVWSGAGGDDIVPTSEQLSRLESAFDALCNQSDADLEKQNTPGVSERRMLGAYFTGLSKALTAALPGAKYRAYLEKYIHLSNSKTAEVLQESDKANRVEITRNAEAQLKRDSLIGNELKLSFTAFDGTKVDLKDLRGKIVLIDFWATWCVPCMRELPGLRNLYAKYKDKGVSVIGISLDGDKKALSKFLTSKGLPWPTYFDGKGFENQFAQRYAVRGIPQLWVINKQGKLVSTDWDVKKTEQELPKLLGSTNSSSTNPSSTEKNEEPIKPYPSQG